MFSTCRLCAEYKEPAELKTQITDLELKLTICCGWHRSGNESRMPTLACDDCVEKLEKSWCFAEVVKAAEMKLEQLIEEYKSIESINTIKLEPFGIVDLDNINENTLLDDVKSEISDSIEDEIQEIQNDESEKWLQVTNTHTHDQILSQLDQTDLLADGTISVNGVKKLEQMFPEIKSITWLDCHYKCGKCKRHFKGPHNFYNHNHSMHIGELNSMTFPCCYCKSEHKKEHYLNQHIATDHFQQLTFRCWYCTDYFWDSRKIFSHRKLHQNIEYQCEICDKVFTKPITLAAHIMQLHQNKRPVLDPYAKFTCDYCSKHFATKTSIKTHMLQHIKTTEFVCDKCGNVFRNKANLNMHLENVHATEKNFVCKLCNGRYKTQYHLKMHEKRHINFKKFMCEICGKRFSEAQESKIHMRVHTDTRSYQCKYCERKFRTCSQLKIHERIHTGEKPYRCSRCDYRCTNWCNLNKHSLRIHSIDIRTKKLDSLGM